MKLSFMQENGPKDGVEPKPEQEPGSSIVTRVTAGINFYGCDTGGMSSVLHILAIQLKPLLFALRCFHFLRYSSV